MPHPGYRGTLKAMTPFTIEPDARGRVSLGQVVEQRMYVVMSDDEGRVVLEPAVVMTSTEERLLADQAFRSEMTAAAAEPTKPFDFGSL